MSWLPVPRSPSTFQVSRTRYSSGSSKAKCEIGPSGSSRAVTIAPLAMFTPLTNAHRPVSSQSEPSRRILPPPAEPLASTASSPAWAKNSSWPLRRKSAREHHMRENQRHKPPGRSALAREPLARSVMRAPVETVAAIAARPVQLVQPCPLSAPPPPREPDRAAPRSERHSCEQAEPASRRRRPARPVSARKNPLRP